MKKAIKKITEKIPEVKEVVEEIVDKIPKVQKKIAENPFTHVESMLKKNPENLLHMLHLAPQQQKVFKFLKEVSAQSIGTKSRYFPKFVDPLKKSHALYNGLKDIHTNAKNLSHLSSAIESELDDGEHLKGGSLWNSVVHGIRHGYRYASKFVKKIPETFDNIHKYASKGIDMIKPIAEAVDLISTNANVFFSGQFSNLSRVLIGVEFSGYLAGGSSTMHQHDLRAYESINLQNIPLRQVGVYVPASKTIGFHGMGSLTLVQDEDERAICLSKSMIWEDLHQSPDFELDVYLS